jgi:hypothetical protein
MRQDDGVVVGVDHAAVGRDALRHLMGVVRRRQAGADVEELADAGLGGQVTDGPAEERAVGPHVGRDPRPDGNDLLGGFPVGGEIVLAAQPVVVDPGRVGHAGVDPARHVLGHRAAWLLLCHRCASSPPHGWPARRAQVHPDRAHPGLDAHLAQHGAHPLLNGRRRHSPGSGRPLIGLAPRAAGQRAVLPDGEAEPGCTMTCPGAR